MFTGKFGVEMECFGVARDVVAQALINAGVGAVVAGYTGSNYNSWQIKTDGSINEYTGFEVVSRVLQGEDGIAEVAKVCEVLESLGAKVNKSCGMHIHHDAASWGIQKFRNLFKRFVKFEAALDSIQPESRRANNNRYCASMIQSYDMPRRIDDCRTVQQLSRLYGDNRYLKLNLQSFFRMGTVEFRNHAGTVSAAKVCNYIRLTGAMVKDANDNVAIKQFARSVTVAESLDTMLSGMVRRGGINTMVANFYKQRQATINTTQEA
jgi:hypothetical protein